MKWIYFFLLPFVFLSGLAFAGAIEIPDSPMVFVQYEVGYCPQSYCQAIFIRKNPEEKTLNPLNSMVFVSTQILTQLPLGLKLYHVQRFPVPSYDVVVAQEDERYIYFYPVKNSDDEPFTLSNHIQVIAGYDNVVLSSEANDGAQVYALKP